MLITVCMYSVFGRTDHSVSPLRMYFILWNVFINFYLSHWEKYNTGVLFLPWGYDASMLVSLAVIWFKNYNLFYVIIKILSQHVSISIILLIIIYENLHWLFINFIGNCHSIYSYQHRWTWSVEIWVAGWCVSRNDVWNVVLCQCTCVQFASCSLEYI